MGRVELSDQQRNTLTALCAFIDDNDRPPTSAELAPQLGVTRTRVWALLNELTWREVVDRDESGRVWPRVYPDGSSFKTRRELLEIVGENVPTC